MSDKRPQIITRKQAKRQINTLGYSLAIYIVLSILLWYGTPFLEVYFPSVFMNADPELVMLGFTAVMMLFLLYVPFRITSRHLDLNIRDYLKKPALTADRLLMLCAMGAAISLAVTGISSYLHILLHMHSLSYSFYGNFSTPYNIGLNVLCFIVIVLIKPWCDEQIFRGIIQRQLGHYGRYFGVLASSFLYAIAQPNLSEALPAFFLGWYLAILTLRYHSVRPAVSVHIFTAALSWLITVLPDSLVLVPTVIVILIYVAAAFALLQRIISLNIIVHFEWDSRLWKILLTSSSVILCILLFIISIILSFL